MNVMGRVRLRRDAQGRAVVEAPPEAAVLADFLEADVGEDQGYFLEKLDQAEAGDEVRISLNARYVEADKTGVRIEHLHRSLLTAWASFLRTP